jgi:hypothetical protein
MKPLCAWIALALLAPLCAQAGVDEAAYRQRLATESIESIERRATYEEQHLDYRVSVLKHREATLQLQYFQTLVIFVLVILLVASGLYLAWRQFRLDEEERRREDAERIERKSLSDEAAGGSPDAPRNTSLELTTQGVKIQSSVIGLIVLTLSLGFFYLYILHVYTITEIGTIP